MEINENISSILTGLEKIPEKKTLFELMEFSEKSKMAVN